jgi:phosphatidylglycerophosphate synthase
MTKRNLTINEIRLKSKYSEEKERFTKNSLWPYHVLRRTSYYLAWIFLRLGISANTITYLSLMIGSIGCMLLVSGTYKVTIIGALLVNLYAFLDAADGTMARCTNTCSKYGAFLDNVVDTTMSVFLFTCAGIGAFNFNYSEQWLNSVIILSNIDRNVFLFLGCWTSLCYIFPRFIGYTFQKTFTEKKFVGREDVLGEPSSFVNILALNFYNITGLVMPILLIAVLFNFLGIFVLLFALINTSAFIVSIILLLRKARASNGYGIPRARNDYNNGKRE